MKIAIVKDTVVRKKFLWHDTWIRMCEENGIDYQVFDSFKPDFIDRLVEYKPDKVLWRSGNSPHMKFKDETQRQILDTLNFRVIPNWRTHWVYDHKIRQTYLFKKHKIPVPETHVFFKEKAVMNFTKRAEYPFVIKADGGAGSKSTRFVEDRTTAVDIIRNTFRRQGKWTGREYEHHVTYIQEYIPIKFVWRVCIIKNDVIWGYKTMVKPGTIKASSQGIREFVSLPENVIKFTEKVNRKLRLDWGIFDFIWSKKHRRYMALEVCDTCGPGYKDRGLTYYKKGNKWVSKEDNSLMERLIFNEFILKDQSWASKNAIREL